MSRRRWPLAALVLAALIGAGCSTGSAEKGTTDGGTAGDSSGNTNATGRDKTAQFPQCMRDNGVPRFPDPNGSSDQEFVEAIERLGPGSAAFKKAIRACRDVQPPGLLGGNATPQQMTARLRFAQCMRDNGVKDFPDPTEDGPLIDTRRIPSLAGKDPRSVLHEPMQKCRDQSAAARGSQ